MGTRRTQPVSISKEPLWYKDAVIYELHVRSFCDSSGDGVGDFRGLTQKLDYLEDLGVTAVWLLPFYPSPLKDDGYDIADYYSINPIYGTLKDFKDFLEEAHKRGLRVITELVVNHTSDNHPWFQKSRRAAPGSHWRDFYVWSKSPNLYNGTRIIFRDFEHSNWTWDPVAKEYFWHRFYSHQPDLNYDNPDVHKEIIRVLDFWLDMGVDGLRLDAVPYLYERENTSCENLPETHQFLEKLREHVDAKYGDRMLLGEANQWPEDAVAYFGEGKGDECHMAFHFPLMPRMFMALRMEDRVPIVDILEQTPAIPETSQWALFLRNHDELTLEMVTDEERDYMYRVYANDTKARINLGIRRRLAPLVGNDRKRIELLHMLLFSLPGTPVLYYGDEIGMGDNVYLGDRNGVRTPMQWSSDRNGGFSQASPHALYLPVILDPEYHYEAVNVDVQRRNPHSLFWWIKRAITLRKRYQAFGRGSLEFLAADNRKVLAFVRKHGEQVILMVANLSRFTQPVELDLSAFQGYVPVEMFGQGSFPLISDKAYFLSMGPHAAYWFALETAASRHVPPRLVQAGEISVAAADWESLLEARNRASLESALLSYVRGRRWFPHTEPKAVRIVDSLAMEPENSRAQLLIISVDLTDAESQEYVVPVAMAATEEAQVLERDSPQLIIARIRFAGTNVPTVLFEAVADRSFCLNLLDLFGRKRLFKVAGGELKNVAVSSLRVLAREGKETMQPALRRADQHHSTIVYGNRVFLKLYRKVEAGQNPELQFARFLSRKQFAYGPTVLGWMEFRRDNGHSLTLASVRDYLPEARDAYTSFVETITRYFERTRALGTESAGYEWEVDFFKLLGQEAPEKVVRLIGTPLELVRLLARRLAALHRVVSSEPDNRDFAPEPFNPFYQRSLSQSLRNMVVGNVRQLRRVQSHLDPKTGELAVKVLASEGEVLRILRQVYTTRIEAVRIRCHGNLQLKQVLYTGKDFLIADFEGDAAKTFGERSIKHSVLYDVASLLRSLREVSVEAMLQQVSTGSVQPSDLPRAEPWADFWQEWVSAAFLRAYNEEMKGSGLLPTDLSKVQLLLRANLLGQCFEELGRNLQDRKDRVAISLRDILKLSREEK